VPASQIPEIALFGPSDPFAYGCSLHIVLYFLGEICLGRLAVMTLDVFERINYLLNYFNLKCIPESIKHEY